MYITINSFSFFNFDVRTKAYVSPQKNRPKIKAAKSIRK